MRMKIPLVKYNFDILQGALKNIRKIEKKAK